MDITIPESLLPPPNYLELLADYMKVKFPNDKNPEIQTDLRQWAYNLREYGVKDKIIDVLE